MKRTRQKVIAGGARHPIYNTWFKMVSRCTDPENKDFRHYGGRGITVCKRWLDFSKFVKDMQATWKIGLTLERRDNAKGYSASNCEWASRQVQALNSRWNHVIRFRGVQKPLILWAQELGINRLTLTSRLSRGWTTLAALTKPVTKIKRVL